MLREDRTMKAVVREEKKLQRQRETTEEKERRAADRAAMLAFNAEQRRVRKEQEKLANKIRRKAPFVDIRHEREQQRQLLQQQQQQQQQEAWRSSLGAGSQSLLSSSSSSSYSSYSGSGSGLASSFPSSVFTISSSPSLTVMASLHSRPRTGSKSQGSGALGTANVGGLDWRQRPIRICIEPEHEPAVPPAWARICPGRFGKEAASTAKCIMCRLETGSAPLEVPDRPRYFRVAKASEAPSSSASLLSSSLSSLPSSMLLQRAKYDAFVDAVKTNMVKATELAAVTEKVGVSLTDCGNFITPPIVTRWVMI